MKLNAVFSKRVVVRFAQTDWVASPMPGVERKMLDRIGAEVARATSLVRYAPGSAFSAHTHEGGEEYLVLEGTFCDEAGAFPTGTYVRNPPTSSHTPSAPGGAIIFVKLHQFDPADRTRTRVELSGGTQPLFSNAREIVSVHRLAPGESLPLAADGGAELLVLDGSLDEGRETLGRWDWLRLPDGARSVATAGADGARVWMKSGHLAHLRAPV